MSAYVCQNISVIHFEHEQFIEYQFCINEPLEKSSVVSLLSKPVLQIQKLSHRDISEVFQILYLGVAKPGFEPNSDFRVHLQTRIILSAIKCYLSIQEAHIKPH